MRMKQEDRIVAFLHLRKSIVAYLEQPQQSEYASLLDTAIRKAQVENAWFTEDSIYKALQGIVYLLEEQKLREWLAKYSFVKDSKTVACVLAGNIPMVGFHDMLCMLLAGHSFVGKLSGKDSQLLPALCKMLIDFAPDFEQSITFVPNLQNVQYDAVIATGSNNSARYFEHYFGQKPHIIRKGRSSVAILSGKESEEDLQGLADDIFMYFGLGCRNVSKLYIPKGFDIRTIFPHFEKYATHKKHHKFMNNYDYNRSINLVNQVAFYETGFAVFQENTELLSPISTVYYEFYEDLETVKQQLALYEDSLQCIVSNEKSANFVPLGKAQFPEVDDYADGIDTLAFLQKL